MPFSQGRECTEAADNWWRTSLKTPGRARGKKALFPAMQPPPEGVRRKILSVALRPAILRDRAMIAGRDEHHFSVR